jgi:hypothetical protein
MERNHACLTKRRDGPPPLARQARCKRAVDKVPWETDPGGCDFACGRCLICRAHDRFVHRVYLDAKNMPLADFAAIKDKLPLPPR